MTIDLSRFRTSFLEEAQEHLLLLETALLRLEHAPGDRELLHEMFRAVHSIKGGSGMLGSTALESLAHGLETLLDHMRQGHIEATPARVSQLLQGRDHLEAVLTATQNNSPIPASVALFLASLEHELQAQTVESPAALLGAPDRRTSTASTTTFSIHFAPHRGFFDHALDPLLLLRDLADQGHVVGVTLDASALPPLMELDAQRCYLAWDVELETERSAAELREIFEFVEDCCTLTVSRVEAAASATAPPPEVSAPTAAAAAVSSGASGVSSTSLTIRVSTEKVDALVDLVGELVISRAMVAALALSTARSRDPLLEEAVQLLDRNVRNLQEQVLGMRMEPVGWLFQRFARVVREASAGLGKAVELQLAGEDTELDKSIIERIADPLTHLIRNAVDHGLEGPDERQAVGKARTGVVRLAAFQESGTVVIEVTDDGRGLDLEAIRRKAIAQGLLSAAEEPDDDQLTRLIFHPGFSTKAEVSTLSGRGVGMDVVRRNIEALNGTIRIRSVRGQGSCFRIQLPLTMAIIEGMQLRVGAQIFVLPLLAITESTRPVRGQVKTVMGRGEVVMQRGEAVTLVRLSRLLGVPGAIEDPCGGCVVFIEHEGRRLGVLADEPLDQSQVVLKSLEANYLPVPGVMGATILGDGSVALILDLGGLFRLAFQGARTRPQQTPQVEAHA